MIKEILCAALVVWSFVNEGVVGFCAPLPEEASVGPLRTMGEVVSFVSDINKFGSDRNEVREVLITMVNSPQDYREKVFLLYEMSSLLSGCPSLQGAIYQSIQTLISRNYRGAEYGGSDEMKLAHVLWMSQTDGYEGVALKHDGYSADCMISIFAILEHQKNGNLRLASQLRRVIEEALRARSISVDQFLGY